MTIPSPKSDLGLVGLGVMGQNLALNFERRGYHVAGYDLDLVKTEAFLSGPAFGKNIVVVSSPAALMQSLERPRRVLMMVPAGPPVDDVIAHLQPHLEQGDILIDGGNTFFMDTERRSRALAAAGFNYVGLGVSGGEEGALWGPSLMPGGQPEAWQSLEPLFMAIAAKAADGLPCVAYLGPRGAGHYVKMVHNGIEYADMQLIAEVYDLLQRGLGLTAAELHLVFSEWNTGELQSYLIEITAAIFSKNDPETWRPLVDLIVDEAQQKGTGKWTSQQAMDIGAPTPTINAALESRILSGLKAERSLAAGLIRGPDSTYRGSRQKLIEAARQALFASKVASYAQGFGLLQLASVEYGYNLHMPEIARIWRAGCIIRATLLEDVMSAYRRDPTLLNLLLDDVFRKAVESRQEAWRFVVHTAIDLGIPVPALSASLAYFDTYRSQRLPANLTQAQRDYFGAHTYRRIDQAGSFHTHWTQS
jgi:6-phosphogluconate dehydrogenase